MAYTEIKQKNKTKYYYRVRTIRQAGKFKKKRIYLGKDLPEKDLSEKIKKADKQLISQKEKEKLKEIKKLIPKIRRILKKHNIKKAGIFGSYVKGKQKKKSDIDILADAPKNVSLFDFAGIRLELEDKLGKKVDLLTYTGIHPYLKERILNSEVRII